MSSGSGSPGSVSRLMDVDAVPPSPGPDRLSALFHMVNRLLPDRQVVVAVPPEMYAGAALALMREHGYSQLPVVQGTTVLGLFTYRAFALEVARLAGTKADPTQLTVEEFLEHDHPSYARLTDEFRGLIDALDANGSIVVSGPDELVAILTPMDVLRYLYSVANAFVLIEEIELSLRSLIRSAAPTPAIFDECVRNALSAKYKEDELPTQLEEMTFEDYISLIRDGRNWRYFESAFGGTRERAKGKLEPIRVLRNRVFHFRGELSVDDHQELTTCRNWLLRRIRNEQAKHGGGA